MLQAWWCYRNNHTQVCMCCDWIFSLPTLMKCGWNVLSEEASTASTPNVGNCFHLSLKDRYRVYTNVAPQFTNSSTFQACVPLQIFNTYLVHFLFRSSKLHQLCMPLIFNFQRTYITPGISCPKSVQNNPLQG